MKFKSLVKKIILMEAEAPSSYGLHKPATQEAFGFFELIKLKQADVLCTPMCFGIRRKFAKKAGASSLIKLSDGIRRKFE